MTRTYSHIYSKKMFIVWIVTALACTHAFPQGAPENACHSMYPKHPVFEKQESASPYAISPRRFQGAVTVTISSLLGTPFQGFMLQGRMPDGRLLGTFENVGEFAHTITCAQAGDTATHNNPNPKNVLEFKWVPPPNYEGPVIFNGTVAQDFSIFWVGVESAPVHISKRFADDPAPSIPTRPFFTSTPPSFIPPSHREAAMDFDPFYTGCSSAKLCFGSPDGCTRTKSCKAAVAVTVAGDHYEFELKATQGAGWVGVGLSDDDKMGDDSVIECARNGNGLGAYLSWTTGDPNYGATRLKNQLGIRLLNQSIVDDTIYCKVSRDVLTTVNGKNFDLRSKYHLLVAAGNEASGQGVGYHDVTFLASKSKRSLGDVSEVAGASKLLIHLHGAFMLAAWIGLVSIGTLLARYYRQTWVGSAMCGKDIWFAWHRLLMMLTWVLTIAGVVLIWVELQNWSKERNPHAILGTVTTVLCFFQPIGAFFRPHPGSSKRPLFNWLHWLAGNAAHIVAIVTIFFAVRLSKAQLPHFVDWIIVGYVAVHVVVHLILSVMGCISEKSADGRVSSFPMKDLGTGRNAPYMDRNVDAPYGGFRKTMLGLYVFIVAIIAIVLILITVLAPIEDTWKAFRNKNP